MPDPKNTIMIYEQVGNSPSKDNDNLIGTATIFPANSNAWSKACSFGTGNGTKKVYAIAFDQNGNESHRSNTRTIIISGT